MPGLSGGAVTGEPLRRTVDTMRHEEWYESERFEDGSLGLATLHHGERDPGGHATWEGSRAAGAIDGAMTNLDELGWTVADFFEQLLDRPAETLRAVDGPFVVACYDAAADRMLVATDKIGCRPCYYTTDEGFAFASEVKALLPRLEEPTVDVQGVSDMLLMGNMWSDDTLVEGVRSLHPATVLEYEGGSVTRERYWQPTIDPARASEAYLYRLTGEFQRAVERISRTLAGDVGLWLSGGLDSRATLHELARNYRDGAGTDIDSLVSFTYDANPGGGVNPRIAREVCDVLELPLEEVPLTAERFAPRFEEVVDVTDGMVRWNTLMNLSSVYNIDDHDPDAMMEGLEGALVGHHLCRHHFTDCSSAVESMHRSESAVPLERVRGLLDADVDPLEPFRREAQRSDRETMAETVIDAHYRNYYHRLAHASNHLPRTQLGTRIPYADGQFLDLTASLPLSYRMGAAPIMDGELIYGVVKPKIRMLNYLDTDLAAIPYERSRLPPRYPYPLHVLGFYASTAIGQLRNQPMYGGDSVADEWYPGNDDLRETVDDLLDSACERSYFDADAVRAVQDTHLRGESSELTTIAAITTVEQWVRSRLD